MASMALDSATGYSVVYGSTDVIRDTAAWDYQAMKGCICNSSWPVGFDAGQFQVSEYFLPDCSYSMHNI